MDEIELKKIREETNNILRKFGNSLSKVKEVKEKESDLNSYREEKEGEKGDKDFRKRFFDNSPKHDDKFIFAEKGSWN